jgi:hypothetical protein
MQSSPLNVRWGRGLLMALGAALAGPACSSDDDKDVRYDPSPPAVVEAMLEMADTQPDDVLYDLGSGDGRIVIAAARDFGVRDATGVEIDPELVEQSRRNAQEAGVADQVRFVQADLFEYDFSDADVVMLFLLADLNTRLRPRLLSELEPGTRVVSHRHGMGDWTPDGHRKVDGHHVYLWIVPPRAEGTWTWSAHETRHRLHLQQRFGDVSGTLERGEHQAAIRDVQLRGDRLRFSVPASDGTPGLHFDGRIDDDTLDGTMRRNGQSMTVNAQKSE